jgi:hypothetical protein
MKYYLDLKNFLFWVLIFIVGSVKFFEVNDETYSYLDKTYLIYSMLGDNKITTKYLTRFLNSECFVKLLNSYMLIMLFYF